MKHLSQGGLLNEGSSCALNSVIFGLHRTSILEDLVNIRHIVNVTDNSNDKAMILLQDILRALPNEKPFSTHKFISAWNESTRNIDNRPLLGRLDDTLLGKHSLNLKYFMEGS